MLSKRLVALVALLVLAGCSGGEGSRPPEPTPTPAPDSPVVLTVTPEIGIPGSAVTATLQLQAPERLERRGLEGSILGWICFQACDSSGTSTSVTFRPMPTDPRSFTAAFTVPLVVRDGGTMEFVPLAAGEYQVHAACVLDQQGGCADRPDASATFQVTAGLETVRWQELPSGEARPVPRLGGLSTLAHSSLPGSQRMVECVAGNLYPHDGEVEPRLLRTDEAGRPLSPIVLQQGGPLVGRHGYAGCADVALDPTHPESFYLMEARHAGGSERAVFPFPQFTMDDGATWAPVPAPKGFDASRSFVGFTMAPEGVTAWFSQASLAEPRPAGESIQGSFTQDGGKTWRTVELTCPSEPDSCLWQMRDKVPWIRDGLIRSADGGKSWQWATMSGVPLVVDQVSVLEGSEGRVLEAVGASTVTYFGFMPLLRTEDGGRSWLWVAVPTPPAGWIETPGVGVQFRLDPAGALMLGAPDGPEQRLARGSSEWTVAGSPESVTGALELAPGFHASYSLSKTESPALGGTLALRSPDGRVMLEREGVLGVVGLLDVGAPAPVFFIETRGGGSMGIYYEAYLTLYKRSALSC